MDESEERPDYDLAVDLAGSVVKEGMAQVVGLRATGTELLC